MIENLQILRTIDKYDKLGPEGTYELLQKSPEEFGAGLDRVSASLIVDFLGTKGSSNDETLNNMEKAFKHLNRVGARLRLMCLLEETIHPDGETLWDKLLTMPCTDDETWADGKRPHNIGWALDDIIEKIQGGASEIDTETLLAQ